LHAKHNSAARKKKPALLRAGWAGLGRSSYSAAKRI
jgi:hypothetical protein